MDDVVDMVELSRLYGMVREDVLAAEEAWADARIAKMKALHPLWYADICHDRKHRLVY